MANPRIAATTPASTTTTPSPMLASSKTESSGIGTTVFSAHQQKMIKSSHTMSSGAVFSPTTPSMVGIPSLVGTPSDTASSLSSFTSTGQQMLSTESVESMVMSPDDTCRTGIVGKTSTFKAHNRKSMDIEKLVSNLHTNNHNTSNSTGNLDNGNIRTVRPTPPSTLNLGPLRIPPAPPPRWNKSATPNSSPNDLTPVDGQTNNFTVTTTVTFSVDGNNVNSQLMEVMSPNANQAVSFGIRVARNVVNSWNLFSCSNFSFKRFLSDYHRKESVKHPPIHCHRTDQSAGRASPAKIPVSAKLFRRPRRKHQVVDRSAAEHAKNQSTTK